MQKRFLSLLVAFTMLVGLAPGTALASNAGIDLQYDDYYPATEAVTEDSDILETVTIGDKDYIHAIGVGTANIKMGETDYTVTVSKAKINLVLIDGQSNARGTAGESNDVAPITPALGNSYIWTGSDITDLKTYVDTQAENSTASIGFHPAIAAEWYELTGEKTVVIHKGHSGHPISRWESTNTSEAVSAIEACIEFLLGNENFEIAHASYYWLQGESNASVEEEHIDATNMEYTTTAEYESAYMAMHDAYISALETSGVDAMGGILTVRSRSNLNGKNTVSEYCGVRAAQQNLANQNPNIIMVSVLTDSWKQNGTTAYSFSSEGNYTVSVNKVKDLFSTSGGPIHYTQAGYNILGLDAADNMYSATVLGVEANDFTLYGHDAVTTYENGDEIILADNMRECTAVNPEEATAAQLVVRTEPSFGVFCGITMTTADLEGNPVDGIIENNGYIADVTKVTEDLELTVTMGTVRKTYILKANTSTTAQGSNYYWDFTDVSAVNGNEIASVTENGWVANILTYTDSPVALNATKGFTNSAGNYFTMDTPVVLPKDSAWAIEWSGAMSSASIVFSNNSDEGVTSAKHEHLWYDGTGVMHFRNASGNDIGGLTLNTSAFSGKDATWYIIHDGNGTLTFAAYYDGELKQASANNAVTADYTINSLMGVYTDASPFCFQGSMRYMKFHNSEIELPSTVDEEISGELTINVPAPVVGDLPQTQISGDNYTGEIEWSPSVSGLFNGETVYTATITLTADSGYIFNDATVADAEVQIAEDGSTLTFTITYPATEKEEEDSATTNYYWTFTSTKPGYVTNDYWSANVLTEKTVGNGKYFAMANAVVLPFNEAWTIEWTGSNTSNSVVLANNYAETISNPRNGEYIYFTTDSTANVIYLVRSGNAPAGAVASMTGITNDERRDANSTWYIINDGSGLLTFAKNINGVITTQKTTKAITEDFTFNAIKGYFWDSMPLVYSGTLKNMKIYHDAAILDLEKLPLNAPATGKTPQSELNCKDGRYVGFVDWDCTDDVFGAETVYTATVTLYATTGYAFPEKAIVSVPGAETTVQKVAQDGSALIFTATFPKTNKAADTTSNFYWDFTNVDAVNGNVVSAVEDDQYTANDLTYSLDTVKLTESGLNNKTNGRGYFTMDTPVYLPIDEQWTIEWKGGTSASSILMANNTSNLQDGHINANGEGHKTSEFIYIYNNYASTQPDNNYITVSKGCTASCNEAAAGFGGITAADRKDDNVVWYLINDENGDLRLEYWKNGQRELVVNENNDLLRTDCTFDSLLGYFVETTQINYYGNLEYLKIYREELMNKAEVKLSVPNSVPATTSLNTTMYSASIDWDDMATFARTETVTRIATITMTAAEGYRFSNLAQFSIPGALETELLEISEDGSTATLMAAFSVEKTVADTENDFYWTFTNGAVSVADETWTENKLSTNGVIGSAYDMATAVTLKQDQAWTIEWTGSSTGSSVVLANNDDTRDATSKGAEYIYIANNSGTAGKTELFFVKSGNAGTTNIRLSNIPDAVKKDANATWYISHDGNGNLTIAVFGAGQFCTTTISGAIDRDYTYNSIKGYFTTSMPIGYNGNLKSLKIYRHEAELPVAVIGTTAYTSLADAIAAVETASYPNTPTNATTIKLLADVESGFDIGIETHSTSTCKTQNIILDLNGYTLTLGHPPVGSSSLLKSNGLRVLAFSKLEIKNGTVEIDNTAVKIGMANYGTLTLTDVDVKTGSGVMYTINNRGNLTLAGETSVANGGAAPKVAITNQPYNYPDSQNINAKLNVASANVVVGDIQVELSDVKQNQTGAENAGVPEINISAGTFGEIYDDGETAKTPIGNISGGTFASTIPENLCAEGYISVNANEDGLYTVKIGEYTVEMTVNGVTTKYETINEAIAAAPVDSYANGKAGSDAEKAVIKLLNDVEGGFDVGIETSSLSTWKIQNIEIDLNGKTLTLGEPLVGSTGTVTNGIRVLAYSKLVIKNGKVSGLDSGALRGLQNYGAAVVEDVVFADMGETYDTIGNFGSLELKGETVVPNGTDSAILNSTYLYSDDSQVPVVLVIEDADVSTGKIVMDLTEKTHSQTGTVNESNPELTINAGNIEEITSTGSDKTLVGGVSGGSFDEIVPESLCAQGYIPTTTKGSNGKYSVEEFDGFTLSGTVTSSGSETGETIIQLFATSGNNVSETVAYEVKVTGKGEKNYTLSGVSAGTYTVKVSKENHVTRSYEINVVTDTTFDLKICLLGDVTGDGNVNSTDYNRMYAHVNGTKPLTGYELLCGNVAGTDAVVNSTDYNRMYAHVNGTKPLFGGN